MQHRSSLFALSLAVLTLSSCAGTGSVTPDDTHSPSSAAADASIDETKTDAGSGGNVVPTVEPTTTTSPVGNPAPTSTPTAAPSPSEDTTDDGPTGEPDPDDTHSDAVTPSPNEPVPSTAPSAEPDELPDAGASPPVDAESEPTSPAPTDSEDPPPGHVAALVGVGYGGLRVVSRDNGETWGDQVFAARNGVDDTDLLRAVTYGKGLWLTTGWNLWTSQNAVEWQEHGLVSSQPGLSACNIIEGLAYADGYFYAACVSGGPGRVFRSADGLDWTEYATIGDTSQHLFLDYRDGTFIAYGDTNTSFVSTDAQSWQVLPGIEQATYCEGEFRAARDCNNDSWFNGAYYRAEWGGYIQRSTDGSRYVQVYADTSGNNLYRSRSIAQGYAAP